MSGTIDQRIAAAKAKAGSRRTTDALAIIAALIACATVLLPWLLGRWVLRGTFFRPTAGDVYDTAVREDGWYFLSDWLAGCAVILLLLALFLLLRPWSLRTPSLVLGFLAAIAACALLLPVSVAQWAGAEDLSAAALRSTPFPFGDSYATCGSGEILIDGHLWQAHSARREGSETSECNRIVVYDGWTRMGQWDIPNDELIDDLVVLEDGTVSATTTTGGVAASFPITQPPSP